MRGHPQDNYPAFNNAAQELRALGHEVFNPAETELPQVDQTIRKYMQIDTAWICEHAEGVALMEGWRTSKGACAESMLAIAVGAHRFTAIKTPEGERVWIEIDEDDEPIPAAFKILGKVSKEQNRTLN